MSRRLFCRRRHLTSNGRVVSQFYGENAGAMEERYPRCRMQAVGEWTPSKRKHGCDRIRLTTVDQSCIWYQRDCTTCESVDRTSERRDLSRSSEVVGWILPRFSPRDMLPIRWRGQCPMRGSRSLSTWIGCGIDLASPAGENVVAASRS